MAERKQPETPELDKLQAVRNESQSIGEFLEWLRTEKKFIIAQDHKASWTCEECGEVPKDEVYFVGWLSTDDAMWRHSAKFCKKVQDVIKKKRSISIDKYQGAPVEHVPEGLWPAHKASTLDLLHEYFEIDADKVEEERRSLLDFVRSANKKAG